MHKQKPGMFQISFPSADMKANKTPKKSAEFRTMPYNSISWLYMVKYANGGSLDREQISCLQHLHFLLGAMKVTDKQGGDRGAVSRYGM